MIFHPGEQAVQSRAGEVAGAIGNGRVIADTILPGARPFIARQSLVAVGAVAPDGSPWASLWFGGPGFLTAGDRLVQLDPARFHRDAGDPLWSHLQRDSRLGLLAIELGSRRRYRINGTVEMATDALRLSVVEAYPNCPKFIHRRIPHLGAAQPVVEHPRPAGLTAEDRDLIAGADTVFVASAVPGGMADASHRGGLAGFIEVLADGRLRLPDYPGNSLFNTWGNLTVDPRAGIVVPDFAGGRVLQIAGPVELLWDQPDPAGRSAGTGRFWTLAPERVRSSTIPVEIAWETLEASPLSPVWG